MLWKIPSFPRKKAGMQKRPRVSPSTCRGSVVFKWEQLQAMVSELQQKLQLVCKQWKANYTSDKHTNIIDNKQLKIESCLTKV
jgi:hypothetical protein